MLPNGSENRQKARADVECNIAVKDLVSNKNIGQIVNLTEVGFMIIGNDLVKENCLYQLQFQLSESLDDISELSIGAECLWQNESGSGTQFWSGFHIIDISDTDIACIEKLMR